MSSLLFWILPLHYPTESWDRRLNRAQSITGGQRHEQIIYVECVQILWLMFSVHWGSLPEFSCNTNLSCHMVAHHCTLHTEQMQPFLFINSISKNNPAASLTRTLLKKWKKRSCQMHGWFTKCTEKHMFTQQASVSFESSLALSGPVFPSANRSSSPASDGCAAAVVKKTTCCCHDAVLAKKSPSPTHYPKIDCFTENGQKTVWVRHWIKAKLFVQLRREVLKVLGPKTHKKIVTYKIQHIIQQSSIGRGELLFLYPHHH